MPYGTTSLAVSSRSIAMKSKARRYNQALHSKHGVLRGSSQALRLTLRDRLRSWGCSAVIALCLTSTFRHSTWRFLDLCYSLMLSLWKFLLFDPLFQMAIKGDFRVLGQELHCRAHARMAGNGVETLIPGLTREFSSSSRSGKSSPLKKAKLCLGITCISEG